MNKSRFKTQIIKKVWSIVIVIFVIACISGCSNSTANNLNNNQTDQTQSNPNKDTELSTQTEKTDIPTEYKSALKKAKIYSDNMNMSKAGIYKQLTSEYGEKFSAEAAQYAIDNVNADWKANALKKAQIYQEHMAMSPKTIYDQLTSEYGEQFTDEEAQYAIDNLK